MKVVYPAGVRYNYVDRNPLVVALHYVSSGVGPHALVTRDTYTVPAGRRALITSYHGFIQRVTTAPAPADYGTRLTCVIGGVIIYVITCVSSTQLANQIKTVYNPQMNFLAAADVCNLESYDLSGGGTVDYNSSVTLLEFDA